MELVLWRFWWRPLQCWLALEKLASRFYGVSCNAFISRFPCSASTLSLTHSFQFLCWAAIFHLSWCFSCFILKGCSTSIYACICHLAVIGLCGFYVMDQGTRPHFYRERVNAECIWEHVQSLHGEKILWSVFARTLFFYKKCDLFLPSILKASFERWGLIQCLADVLALLYRTLFQEKC